VRAQIRRWLFRLQESAGLTHKECNALLLLSALLLVGAAVRYLPKSDLLIDESYYAPIDEEFRRLAARADSIDRTREEAALAAEQAFREERPAGPVDLNAATNEELQRLPRVGPRMAERILELRRRIGRFADVSDLLMVPGIGEKTLEQIRDSVRVGPEAGDP
jgi:competence protein ComEA